MADPSLITYIPITGKTRITFYDCASKIYNIFIERHEFDRLKKVKHLGLMSRVFDSSNHTRYEYLMLQCAIVELVDTLNKGASQVALGDISINGLDHMGNGLLKSWFMLSNYGHCFNTFGDSKSLLLYLLQNKPAKAAFINSIKDRGLKHWSRTVINNYDYRKFNYVITIYRLSKEYYRSSKKTTPLMFLKLLLLPENKHPNLISNWPKLTQLRRMFQTIRDIAILAIDGHYTHTPISIDIISLISSMRDSEHAYNENFISKSLEPLLAILNEEIYLDKNVVGLQRAYEIEALELLKTKSDFKASVETALTKGLIDKAMPLQPFLRLKLAKELTPTSTIYDELRTVRLAGKACPNIELTIDQNFYQGHRYLDVLASSEKLSRKEIGEIYNKISILVNDYLFHTTHKKGERLNHIKRTLEDKIIEHGGSEELNNEVHKLWSNEMFPFFLEGMDELATPSYKAILYSALKYIFLDQYDLDLKHINKNYKPFDFRMNRIRAPFDENLRVAKEKNRNDIDRLHEVKVIEAQLKNYRGPKDNYVYACIDRLLVLDTTASPEKRMYTDLDGVILFVSDKDCRLEIIEAKNTGNAEKDAKKDISKKLLPALNKERIKGYRISTLKNKGAKLVIKF